MGSVLGLLPTVMAWLPAKATLGLFDWVFVGVILLVVTFLLEFVNCHTWHSAAQREFKDQEGSEGYVDLDLAEVVYS